MFEIEITDHIATMRMAHGRVNALDGDFLRAFAAELEGLSERDLDAIVLTGTGAVFSAGADLFRVRDAGPAYIAESLPALSEAFLALFTFPRPVVAAINGHAIAGGAVIACAADHRVMARGDTTIGLGELRVGVPFPAAALEIVRFATGGAGVQELLYVADSYGPDNALARRLVDEVVEPSALLARAREVAARRARIPRASFLHTKLALRREALSAVARYAPEADAEAVAIWSSEELHERIDAFLGEMFGDRARRAPGA